MVDMEDQDMVVDTETLPLCRLCVSNHGKYQIGPHMQSNIKKMFEISIDSYDGMSQIMCADCRTFLHKVMRVKDMFKQNQDVLSTRRQKIANNEMENLPCFKIGNVCISSIFTNSVQQTPPPPTPPPPPMMCSSTTITHPNESSVIINLDQSVSPAPDISIKEEIKDESAMKSNCDTCFGESMEISQNESPVSHNSVEPSPQQDKSALFYKSPTYDVKVNYIGESKVTSPSKPVIQDKSISPSVPPVAIKLSETLNGATSVNDAWSDDDMGGDNVEDDTGGANVEEDMEMSPVASPAGEAEPVTPASVDSAYINEEKDNDLASVRCTRNSTKYNCIFCVKFTLDGTQLKRHIHTHHTGLLKKLKALTVPCSVRMKNIKSTTLPDDWVHFDSSKVYQYNPKDSCFFLSKQRRMINPVLAMSSSEDEEEQPSQRYHAKRIRQRSRKKILTSPVSSEWTGQDSRSSLSSVLNEDDSTRRSSVDFNINRISSIDTGATTTTTVSRTVNAVQQVSHTGYNSRSVRPIGRSASDEEIPTDYSISDTEDERDVQDDVTCMLFDDIFETKKDPVFHGSELRGIIETCVDNRLDFVNSSIEDLMETYSGMDVAWKQSDAIEVTCVRTLLENNKSQDVLANLSLYADMDRNKKGLSHLRLLQPPPSNYNDTDIASVAPPPVPPANVIKPTTDNVINESPKSGAEVAKSAPVFVNSNVTPVSLKNEPPKTRAEVAKSAPFYINPNVTPVSLKNEPPKSGAEVAKSAPFNINPNVTPVSLKNEPPKSGAEVAKSAPFYVNPNGTPIKTYNRSKSATNRTSSANSNESEKDVEKVIISNVKTVSKTPNIISKGQSVRKPPNIISKVQTVSKTPVISKVQSVSKTPVIFKVQSESKTPIIFKVQSESKTSAVTKVQAVTVTPPVSEVQPVSRTPFVSNVQPEPKTPTLPSESCPLERAVETLTESHVQSAVESPDKAVADVPVVDITKQNIAELPLLRLKQLLKDNQVTLVLCEAKNQVSKRLIRISLKLARNDELGDYFLDLLIRGDLAFVLLIADQNNKVFDIEEWPEQVQTQVMKSLKSPKLIETLRLLACKFGRFSAVINKFSQIVESFI